MDTPILVTVRYTVKPGKREELYRKIVEQHIDVDSRAEAGNRKYAAGCGALLQKRRIGL